MRATAIVHVLGLVMCAQQLVQPAMGIRPHTRKKPEVMSAEGEVDPTVLTWAHNGSMALEEEYGSHKLKVPCIYYAHDGRQFSTKYVHRVLKSVGVDALLYDPDPNSQREVLDNPAETGDRDSQWWDLICAQTLAWEALDSTCRLGVIEKTYYWAIGVLTGGYGTKVLDIPMSWKDAVDSISETGLTHDHVPERYKPGFQKLFDQGKEYIEDNEDNIGMILTFLTACSRRAIEKELSNMQTTGELRVSEAAAFQIGAAMRPGYYGARTEYHNDNSHHNWCGCKEAK